MKLVQGGSGLDHAAPFCADRFRIAELEKVS
jgi:hypothetical protein